MNLPSLYSYRLDELEEEFVKLGIKKFNAKQVYK
jgi:adenine C2-methylase RlmN of 23S rRNA A2503 and tRNA A37